VQAPFNRVDYLLEAFPEQPAGFVMDEALGAGQNKCMRSQERANNNTANLTYSSGAFRQFGHPCSYEPGCYTGADGHDWTFDTCR
jgi:hypothetical protein